MLVELLLVQAVAGPVVSTSDSAPPDTARHVEVCWTPHPAPRCNLIFVTDFGVSGSGHDSYDPRMELEFGLLWMLERRTAVGITVLSSGDESHSRRGVLLQARRWIWAEVAVGASAGPITFRPSGEGGSSRAKGYQLGGALYLGPLGLTATYEHLGTPTSDPFTSAGPDIGPHDRWYTGVKGTGPVGLGVLAGLAIITAATWD